MQQTLPPTLRHDLQLLRRQVYATGRPENQLSVCFIPLGALPEILMDPTPASGGEKLGEIKNAYSLYLYPAVVVCVRAGAVDRQSRIGAILILGEAPTLHLRFRVDDSARSVG